uniref:tumor necrosis factor receptor superfamily member 6B n=1 Tax=Semicossyphus pulcher TaxID=241346 RepID=UPI0037E8E908
MMWTMLFLLVASLSMHAAVVDGVAGPLLTFRETDPITGRSLECDRCPPGEFLRARCTETRKSVCAPCPTGSFTELWNYIGKCLRCGVCGHNQVVKTECSAERDCQCACRPGYYYKEKYDMCLRHSECPSGQEVLSIGTADDDTVCRACPNDTFSNIVSANKRCTEHKVCSAAGSQLVLKGSTWHDSVCTSCEESTSKDGGDYLKEIIPSFFVHHKMSVRRLRQILRKLPTEDGKKHEGIHRLSVSDLHKHINAWVASATAAQIRQLPAILIKTGANSAGERLQYKLNRIDSVSTLCGADKVMVVL